MKFLKMVYNASEKKTDLHSLCLSLNEVPLLELLKKKIKADRIFHSTCQNRLLNLMSFRVRHLQLKLSEMTENRLEGGKYREQRGLRAYKLPARILDRLPISIDISPSHKCTFRKFSSLQRYTVIGIEIRSAIVN